MSTTLPHHPDDTLSAVLDGEASAEEAAHVSSCHPCRSRMELLRAASVALAEPPPVDPVLRDVHVSTAIARGAARLVPGGSRTDDHLADGAEQSLRQVRRQPPAWVVAAGTVAAAVVVFLGLVALGSGSDDIQTASDTPASAGPDAGFLGSFDDGAVLSEELKGQLGVNASGGATAAGGGGEDLFAPGAGDRAEEAQPEAAPAPARSDDAVVQSGPGAGTLPRLTDEEMASCADALADEFPDRGELVLSARIVWQGEPAAVFVHRTDSGEDDFRAWIYAGDPCALHTFLSF